MDEKTGRVRRELPQDRFRATPPNQRWGVDIPCISTAVGFEFLAVVLDVWSRRVLGWPMAGDLRTELVMDVLQMV